MEGPCVSRVLVIDDDPRFPEYLQALLGATGGSFKLDVAQNVDDGLRELSAGASDVCLLDYRLGSEDGLDVLRRAKEQGLRTPIVLLTGEGSDMLAFSAIEQGAADYLDKSELDPLRLQRTLCRAVARRRAELALRDREVRLEEAEAFAHVMQAQMSLEGRWTKVPRRLCELLGYTDTELLGHSTADITHPDDRLSSLARPSTLLDGSTRSVEFEKRLIRKDGATVWMYLNVSLVTDDAGAPRCFVAFLRDISDQKRSEEARIRLEEQLRQSQKMEAIGQLAGGVAHDFNNLLTAILGYTDLLLERCHDAPDVCADLEEIKSAGSNAAALTEQLLAFGRRQLLNPQVLSVDVAITNMGNLLRRVLGEDIELVTASEGSQPFVKADPVQLQQVILNLAVNARDAMKRRGKLTIDTSEYVAGAVPEADAPSLQPGRYVRITVEDTGSGMDAATQAHIFEPFFTTKAPGKGTGLGLATAYGIIKQSGGDIVCRSHLGVGTRFSIYLPACTEASRRPARTSADRVRGSETILLVEDQAPLRRLTRRILEEHGYRVFDTGNPEMAVHVAEGSAFDLLLTDVVMPQMTGPDLARDIHRSAPDVPVLFMSGFAGHSALTDLAGAPLLGKPFTPTMLITKVRDLLDRAEPRVREGV